MKKEHMFVAGALITTIIAFAIYNLQMLANDSSPNAASWAVWSFVTVLNFASYKALTRDCLKTALPVTNSTLCVVTFLFAIYAGRMVALNPYDIAVLGMGIVAALAWWKTKSPAVAQVLLQIAVLIGFIPTYTNVYVRPENELPGAWLLWTLSSAFQFFLVKVRHGAMAAYIYPVNSFINHISVALLALRA